MSRHNKSFINRIDGLTLLLYFLLVCIGIVSIFSVEHRTGDSIFLMKASHMQQAKWWAIALFIGLIILFTDSKAFASVAFLSYALGILLLIITIFVAPNIKGSHSWLRFGGFQFQPGEVCKIFTALALAKFLSMPETNFKTLKDRLIGCGIAFLPLLIIIAQNETGLALVYFSFILVLYREGLPGSILLIGISMIVLGLASLLLSPKLLLYIILGISAIAIYILRRPLRKDGMTRLILVGAVGVALLFSQVLIPFAFKHVLKPYQINRIYSLLGTEVPEEFIPQQTDDPDAPKKDYEYNVNQSKIAIGSGGLFGKGLLNGTSTRGDFVPEQHTDFIFCSVGEQFGFAGSTVLILLYIGLMLRIVHIAERQRSAFSRVYAYCVAAILFFHFAINISMTIGLAPVIGITLPFLSYGGSSLLSFSVLIFIMVRLDADRGMVIR